MDERTPPLPIDALHAESGWVRRVARALAGGGADADDLEQEVWVRALERPPRVLRSPRAWLGTVLRNVASDLRRATRRRRAREGAAAIPAEAATPAAADIVARAESLRAVVDALLRLREPYRSTLLLRYQEGLSPSAIARRLDLPRETVRTRLRRGLEELREDLGAGDEEERRAILLPLLGSRALPPPVPGAGIPDTGAWAGGDRAARAAAAAFREVSLMNVRILGAAGLSLVLVAGAVWWAFRVAEPPAGAPEPGPPAVRTPPNVVAASGDRAEKDLGAVPCVVPAHRPVPDSGTPPPAAVPTSADWDTAALETEVEKLRQEVAELRRQPGERRDAKPPAEDLATISTADLLARILAITRAKPWERKGPADKEGGLRLAEELLSRGLTAEERAKALVEKAILVGMEPDQDLEKKEAVLREAATLQGEDTTVGRETLFQLAWTRSQRGDDREAADLFEKVADNPAIEPGFRATSRWDAAQRADRLGDRDRARRLYEKFIAENESREGPWYKDCVAKARKRLEELR